MHFAAPRALDEIRRRRLRTPSTGLPREFYTDPDLFNLDLDLIFYREWLFAGHTAELPAIGSYMTLQVGDYPVVLVKGRDEVIRAFINSCRHRGARLCTESRGTVKKLVCPYRQWICELDGRLFAARHMGAGFDRSKHGLRPISCESVAGYIFVYINANPPDFAPTRDLIEPYLEPHRLWEAKIAFESTIVEEGNWKLVWENNRECYHCAANHPELARTFLDTPAVTGVGHAPNDPQINKHWKQCETAGLQSRLQLTPDGQMRVTRMPMVRASVSYTMTGQPAVNRRLSDAVPPDLNVGALLLFHYPTTWNHVLGDHAISFRVLPLSPTRTALTTKWLVHRDAVEGTDYNLEELTRVWLATNEQDQRIVSENQIGMNCPTYEPGPLSSSSEDDVSQFLDWYCNRLEKRMLNPNIAGAA